MELKFGFHFSTCSLYRQPLTVSLRNRYVKHLVIWVDMRGITISWLFPSALFMRQMQIRSCLPRFWSNHFKQGLRYQGFLLSQARARQGIFDVLGGLSGFKRNFKSLDKKTHRLKRIASYSAFEVKLDAM